MAESLHSKCCLFIICLCITILGMCYNYEGLKCVKLQLKPNFPAEIWLVLYWLVVLLKDSTMLNNGHMTTTDQSDAIFFVPLMFQHVLCFKCNIMLRLLLDYALKFLNWPVETKPLDSLP